MASDPTQGAEGVAEHQRSIQRSQDQQDELSSSSSGSSPQSSDGVQAGARDYPTELPAQHIDKPGHESEAPATSPGSLGRFDVGPLAHWRSRPPEGALRDGVVSCPNRG